MHSCNRNFSIALKEELGTQSGPMVGSKLGCFYCVWYVTVIGVKWGHF